MTKEVQVNWRCHCKLADVSSWNDVLFISSKTCINSDLSTVPPYMPQATFWQGLACWFWWHYNNMAGRTAGVHAPEGSALRAYRVFVGLPFSHLCVFSWGKDCLPRSSPFPKCWSSACLAWSYLHRLLQNGLERNGGSWSTAWKVVPCSRRNLNTAVNGTTTSAKRWKTESRLKRPRPRFCKEELNLTILHLCTQIKWGIF